MKTLVKVVPLVLLTTLLLILAGRVQLAWVRMFDPDELAHMHWAFLISQGGRPFKDFFFYLIPVFQWLLAPLFLLPHTPLLTLVFRLVMVVIYLATLVALYRLALLSTKNTLAALLATVIFAVFPMTLDKTIDVRPDTLMTLLFLLAALLLLPLNRNTPRCAFLAGLAFCISFLTIFKIVYATPALLFLVLTGRPRLTTKVTLWGIAGFLLPVALTVLYIMLAGIGRQAYESLFFASFAVNLGKLPFSPLKTLSPWPIVYVQQGGVSFPWATNIVIWLLSLAGVFLTIKINRRAGLFFLIFIAGSIIFFVFFPVPYVQYFISLSALASISAALTLTELIDLANRYLKSHFQPTPVILYLLLCVALASSFWLQYSGRVTPGGSNAEQLEAIKQVLMVTKPNEPIYDMTGTYIFRPDGYYICCHPYQEFVDQLKTKPPALRESLIATKTKFLVLDQKGYVFWHPQPDDLDFILTQYLPTAHFKLYSLGVAFRCENSRCIQYNLHRRPNSDKSTNVFSLAIAETYRLSTEPLGATVQLDGQLVNDGSLLVLAAGFHRFQVDPSVAAFTLQLPR